MKHILDFKNFSLNEGKLDSQTIYNTHYKDIDAGVYRDIVESDPTSKNNVNGKYTKWLLELHRNGRLKKEDYYKATSYLKAFHDFNRKFPIKDINQIKSIQDLFKMVKDYVVKQEDSFSEDVNTEEYKLKGQFKEVFTTDKYRVIVPLTLKASQYFGRETEWCTTHENNFEHYTRNQTDNNLDKNCLYIMYSEDSEEKLQFHFGENQFMDYTDMPIYIVDFFKENPELEKFFENTIGDLRPYYMDANEYAPIYFEKLGIKVSMVNKDVGYELDDLIRWEDSENLYNDAKEIILKYDGGDYRDEYKQIADSNADLFIIEGEFDVWDFDSSQIITQMPYYLVNKSNPNITMENIDGLLRMYFPNKLSKLVELDKGFYTHPEKE